MPFRRSRFGKHALIALLVIVALLVAARAALPWYLKKYINDSLDGIPGYYGHVADVDVALWRGAYNIQGLSLVKTNGSEREPFVAIDDIDISVDWRAIFDGRLVSKIKLLNPKLQFVQRASKSASQTSIDESWQQKVTKLTPFEVNRFTIVNGLVRYKDQTRDPKINVYFKNLDLSLTNISNTKETGEKLPSDLNLTAKLLDSGNVKAKAKLNLLEEPYIVDINASVKHLDLKELNEFTKAYGNFDFEKGKFSAALELAASKTRYEGYVKTLAEEIDVVDVKKELKEGDSPGHVLWEALVGGVTQLFKNQKRDRFAARIPITGTRKEIEIKTWPAVGSVLKNAFIKALTPELEDTVEFKDAARGPASEKK